MADVKVGHVIPHDSDLPMSWLAHIEEELTLRLETSKGDFVAFYIAIGKGWGEGRLGFPYSLQ